MISKEEVQHVAALAKLELTDDQLEMFTGQLDEIIDMVDQLSAVDTTNVAPTTQMNEQTNVFRADEPKPGTPLNELMENVPDEENDLIKVPAIMDKEED